MKQSLARAGGRVALDGLFLNWNTETGMGIENGSGEQVMLYARNEPPLARTRTEQDPAHGDHGSLRALLTCILLIPLNL